ncbi:MAG: isoprenyl transferase [Actinobacteria bacterium]|nr:isoprenyl transferase [Actinomycetota bacterium]
MAPFKSPTLSAIKKNKIPIHIAIIMDGNGRWAGKRGLPRIVGHKKGVDALKNIVTLCKDVGIKYLTVYSFSSENWQRPQDEVSELMDLFVEVLQRELESLHKNGIKIVLLGQRETIPSRILKIFEISEEKTKDNKELLLNVAFSYGSRQEIANAAKKMCIEYKNKEFSSEENIEKIFSKFLYTSDCPDPDLLIRTSGEYRISNFLLWQIAYTELYFTKTLWPDFDKKNFYKAIYDYQRRNRRFGKL